MSGHANPQSWQCSCCEIPRQIYFVTWCWGTEAYHEDDFSPAKYEE